jgi:hypothetical protein
LVLVALAGVALIGVTGLALDAGYAAGKLRATQNAVDAGSLAAARTIAVDGQSSTPTFPSQSTLQTVSNTEVQHNGAIPGTFSSGGGGGGGGGSTSSVVTGGYDYFIPDTTSSSGATNGTSGEKAHVALATISASLAGVASVNVALDEATAAGAVGSAALGGHATASGQVDVANVQANILGIIGTGNHLANIHCLSSSRTYSSTGWTSPPGTSCDGALGGLVDGILGIIDPVISAAGVSVAPGETMSYLGSTPAPYFPQAISTQALATSHSATDDGTAVSTGVGNVTARIGPSPSVLASADLDLATLAVSGILSGSAAVGTVHAELDYSPTGGITASWKCDTASVTISGTAHSLPANCAIAGLPLTIAGVSVRTNTYAMTCVSALNCQLKGCLLDLSVAATVADVCIGEIDLTAVGSKWSTSSTTSGTGSTGSGGAGSGSGGWGTAGGLTGCVTTTGYTNSPTFFMSVLGWLVTHPSASSSSCVLQVADESDAAFTNASYAMPDWATPQDCSCNSAPLTVGHQYYLFGSSMQAKSPVPKFSSSWAGQVGAGSGHSVGSTLSPVSGTGPGPGTYVSGGSYYLLPVINPSTAIVEYYAVFKTVPGYSYLGTLTSSIIADAAPAATWSPYAAAGAAATTVKVTR